MEEFEATKKMTLEELRKSLRERIEAMLLDPYYLATQISRLYAILNINERLERRQYTMEEIEEPPSVVAPASEEQ